MTWILVFLLCVVCFKQTNAVCENVDTKACQLLSMKHEEMCSDPCLSKMCARFCERCPVKCYQCHEIDNPPNCNTLIDCPSTDHYCFTTQTFTTDFTKAYTMGCATKDVCRAYLGPHKRNIDVNGACCMDDKCNNRVPSQIMASFQIPSASLTGEGTYVTLNTHACQNLDDMACTRFAAAKPDICSDTCIATNVCPHMCGKCINCYTCNDIDHVGDCNSTGACGSGHECFVLKTLSIDQRPVFRVGCMEEALCSKFITQTPVIFGKREDFALKGSCCKTNLCNDHIRTYTAHTTSMPTHAATLIHTHKVHTHAATVMPTHSATHCPHAHRHCPAGFLSNPTSCYKIGPTEMTRHQAKIYCQSLCARLADFSSRTEMINMFKLLVPHHNGNYQAEKVWTDAVYSRSHNQWVWQHNDKRVDSSEFNHLSAHTRGILCSAAVVHTTAQHTTNENVVPEACTHLHFPLCEAVRTP